MKRLLPVLFASLLVPAIGSAEVKTRKVEYRQGETVCEGWISYDDALTGPRPGVLIVHDWLGLSDYQKMRAEMLAKLGYVAFACDIYGKGVRPANAQEAGAEAGKYYGDRALFRARARAGFDELVALPQVDPARVAAIGYCFGGLGALELARSGAPLRAVVTFHGSLANPAPEDAKKIVASVLVLHGADDPFVKADEVKAFMDEMRAAGRDYEVVQYSGAVHSFSDRRAGTDNGKGAAYNATADRRSWQAMKDFLEERFAK